VRHEALPIFAGDDIEGDRQLWVADAPAMEDSRAEAIGAALADLAPRERHIFTARHLNDDPATLDQLGDELGISRERVRQVANIAFRKVSERVTRLVGDQDRIAAEISADWRRDLHALKYGQRAAAAGNRAATFEARLTRWAKGEPEPRKKPRRDWASSSVPGTAGAEQEAPKHGPVRQIVKGSAERLVICARLEGADPFASARTPWGLRD